MIFSELSFVVFNFLSNNHSIFDDKELIESFSFLSQL